MNKPWAYTPQDRRVLSNADRVVIRTHTYKRWAEREFFPDKGQTVADVVEMTWRALREMPAYQSRALSIYLGAEINGERAIAMIPKETVPGSFFLS